MDPADPEVEIMSLPEDVDTKALAETILEEDPRLDGTRTVVER